jgi:hypothetical protein
LWPFDGDFHGLLQPGKIVIAETYPVECCGWLLPAIKGKGKQEVRRAIGSHLTRWAVSLGLASEPALLGMIKEGFPKGDDAFDAVAGLFWMVEVALGRRKSGEPSEDRVRNVEGWILGQRSITKAESRKSG